MSGAGVYSGYDRQPRVLVSVSELPDDVWRSPSVNRSRSFLERVIREQENRKQLMSSSSSLSSSRRSISNASDVPSPLSLKRKSTSSILRTRNRDSDDNMKYLDGKQKVNFLLRPDPGDNSGLNGFNVPSSYVETRRRAKSSHDIIQNMASKFKRRYSTRRGSNQLDLGDFHFRETIQETAPRVNKEKCLRKFVLWATVVFNLMKLKRRADGLLFLGTLYKEPLEHIDRVVVRVENKHHYAAFRPDEYKANRQMRMSAESKRILQKPPEKRTDKEVTYAMIALRSIDSISGYPVRMQRQLAKHGVFESFGSKRILVKQGHSPNAFYFILFGTVVVAVQPDEVQDATVVVKLERGETFGELAIMNREPRQSTVITQDYTELLSIDIKTYQRLFMVGGQKNVNDLDHNAFMQSLPFLRSWPLDFLQNNNESVRFCYTRRDDVIIHDSSMYKWIVVVKSGSVQVLKKLLRTKSTVNKVTGYADHVQTEREQIITFLHKPESVLSDNDVTRSVSSRGRTVSFREDFEASEDVESESQLRPDTENSRDAESPRSPSPRLLRPKSSINRPATGQPQVNALSMVTRMKTSVSAQAFRRRKMGRTEQGNNDVTGDLSEREKQLHEAISNFGKLRKGKRTFLHDLDAAYFYSIQSKTAEDLNPEFVHVQTLTKGDVFGLHEMLFVDQPRLCLVSNGAECIFIKKTFYEKHAPEELIESLKREISPYPEQTKFQDDLQTVVNWRAYKDYLLKDMELQKVKQRDLKLWTGL